MNDTRKSRTSENRGIVCQVTQLNRRSYSHKDIHVYGCQGQVGYNFDSIEASFRLKFIASRVVFGVLVSDFLLSDYHHHLTSTSNIQPREGLETHSDASQVDPQAQSHQQNKKKIPGFPRFSGT